MTSSTTPIASQVGEHKEFVRDEWVRAEPKWLRAKLVTILITIVVVGVIACVPFFIWSHTWLMVFPGLVLLLGLAEGISGIFEVKTNAVMLRDDEVLYRTGSISKSVRAVPLGRVQYVDLLEGPIDSACGLASVSIRTAASDGGIHVKGLATDSAHRLRDTVLAAAELRRAEL